MDIKIEKANLDDAEAIADIQTQTWVDTYPNLEMGITKEDVQAKFGKTKQGLDNILSKLKEKDTFTWVAKDGQEVVGFMAAKKSNNKGEFEALHILPGYQGKGIGTKLMQSALRWLQDFEEISLGVVSYNTRAIKFYESFGFVKGEEVTDDIITLPSGKIIPKIKMHRVL